MSAFKYPHEKEESVNVKVSELSESPQLNVSIQQPPELLLFTSPACF